MKATLSANAQQHTHERQQTLHCLHVTPQPE